MDLDKILDEIPSTIKKAIKAWQKQNSAKSITEEVHAKLNKNKEEVLLKLMGFDNHWGRWEVDHCNGRNGNSPIGDKLKNIHNAAIEEWLHKISLPEPPPELIESIQKKYLNELEYCLKRTTVDIAKSTSSKLVDTITKDIIDKAQTKLENTLKTEKFLKEG